ncbi:MAG: hypothetical protein JSS61_06905 [Verrucomicrobia bacterium]|nr:hypothetical protein [Verrucomicrobiota bacterium]
MTTFADPVKSTAFAVYTPPQSFHVQARAHMEKMQNLFMERSFKTQMADCRLSAVTVRALILAGAIPSPQNGPGLPERFPGTMADLLDGVREGESCTVRETIKRTINDISYNSLQPFNKTVEQILYGRSLLETRIDSRDEEETGSTCIGMSHALLKQLSNQHGIEGMYAAQRKKGKAAFEHATVIVECTDGYLLLDPRSHPDYRIFPIPFDGSVTIHGKTFTAADRGSQIPISQIDRDEEWEYCTNIANADDIITKHFIMEAPFNPPENPAFPISAYYLEGEKTGRGSRTIWVSPLQAKLTFKNDTVEGGPERTSIVSFKEVLDDGFRDQLERYYVVGTPPTFNIDVESLYEQFLQFVTNAGIIDEMFREIYSGSQISSG